jgi:serine/threonine-protein kinase
MPDLVGQTLKGRYHVQALLGHGGMADVYKAWDSYRQYHVAIKVMREDLAEDPEFARRFQREAGALAQLAHENIVRFYSFEQEDLTAFIVMDYIEGITLRTEIARARGPLPLAQALAVTGQVCAALHYAHAMGVLHRDIKPANIMLRSDGRVLLSDFGIAKVADATTATSVIPGTPAYMSPEHCLSQRLDARADIYSLGVVVYEMLAGRRPFSGDSPAAGTGSTAERIRWEHLYAPVPPLRQFNPSLSPELEAAVMRALEKDKERRWPSVLAFWQALSAATATADTLPLAKPTPPPASAATRTVQPRPTDQAAVIAAAPVPASTPAPATPVAAVQPASRRSLNPVVLAGVLAGVLFVALAIAALVLVLNRSGPATPSATSLALATIEPEATVPTESAGTTLPAATMAPPGASTPTGGAAEATLEPWPVIVPDNAARLALRLTRPVQTEGVMRAVADLALTRDGTFVATVSGQQTVRIWRLADWRLMTTLDAGARSVNGAIAFSPDGRLVASPGADHACILWRLPDASLFHQLRGHTEDIASLTFSPDGKVLVTTALDKSVRLWRTDDGSLLNTLPGSNKNTYQAVFSPDASLLAVAAYDQVLLFQFPEGKPLPPLEGGFAAAFSPDGQLLATGSQGGAIRLWQVADRSLLRVLEGHNKSISELAFSPDGALLASTSWDATLRLWRVADGQLLTTVKAGEAGRVPGLAFTPDGQRLLTGTLTGMVNFWGIPEGGAGPTPLPPKPTPAGAGEGEGAGAQQIAWAVQEGDNWDIVAANPDGSGLHKLTNGPEPDREPAWSPDFRRIAFFSNRETGTGIYIMNADGSDLTFLVNGRHPTWSPDGSRIAFDAKRGDNTYIYLINVDGTDERWLTDDPNVGQRPSWSPDGSRIAFESRRDGNAEIYVINVDGTGLTNLTNFPGDDTSPSWSPDGSLIAFASSRTQGSMSVQIQVMRPDGSDVHGVTSPESGRDNRNPSWSPDGKRIAFEGLRDDTNWDVYVVNADGSGLRRLTDSPNYQGEPSWGPR